MKENRTTVINVLPQGEGAWQGIALAAFFISGAFAINSMAGCNARVEEARYQTAKHAVELAKP